MLPNYQLRSTYQGYALYLRSPGFEFTPISLQKIASFIIQDGSGHLGVAAFAYSVLVSLEGAAVSEDALLDQAVAVIQRAIDAGELRDRTDLTYELREGAFAAVDHPSWWVPSFPPLLRTVTNANH